MLEETEEESEEEEEVEPKEEPDEEPEEIPESEQEETKELEPITNSEIDLSSLETKEEFSRQTRSGGSSAWDKSKISEVIQKLKVDTSSGEIRVIPISWIWENLRNNQGKIKYTGFYCRKVFSEEAKRLGIGLEIRQTGCVGFELSGQLEVRFV